MAHIRLANLKIHWTGVDDTTPDGHVLVTATDSLGNLRVCLYAGDEPSDDTFRGSLLIPQDNHGQAFLPTQTTAYGPGGGFVTTIGDQTDMLARLARRP
ncbi:hypothetical protein [Streptomyces albidoflavus]|uniref:hypothetical protein n=1 Tax=Streptomyces albidoflavus TaxID=1886 RepID=UPI0033F9428D